MKADDRQRGLKVLVESEPGAFRSAAAIYILWNLVQAPDPHDLDFVLSVAKFKEYHASRYALYCLGFYDAPEAREAIERYLRLRSRRAIWATAAAANMADPQLRARLETIAQKSREDIAAALAAEGLARFSRKDGIALLKKKLHEGSGWPALNALSRLGEFGEWRFVADELAELESRNRAAALRYLLDAPDENAKEIAQAAMAAVEQTRGEIPASQTANYALFLLRPADDEPTHELMLPPLQFLLITPRLNWEDAFKEDETSDEAEGE